MKILKLHHVNCASFHPLVRTTARHRDGRWFMCTRALIVETPRGIVAVDTGFGTEDIERSATRLGRGFTWMARPRLDTSETMIARLQALNLKPSDVTDILITHLDLDHSGGLAAFPNARVHVHRIERDAALVRATATRRARYLPLHWAHEPVWAPFEFRGDTMFGFDTATLDGLPPEIKMVSLPGHTVGHCGVLIEANGTATMHAGDAFMEIQEMVDPAHKPSFATRMHHRFFDDDPITARATRDKLRAAVRDHRGAFALVGSHDVFVMDPDGSVRQDLDA